MPSKADFTPDEWTIVQKAPLSAAIYVLSASPSGPIGVAKELFAATAELAEVEKNPSAPQILKDIVADARAQRDASEAEPSAIDQRRPERASYLANVREAVALIDAKAGSDTLAIKQWIYGIGQKVAAASNEGGFLGFGGTAVSDAEQTALGELAAILGT
jgi:hypothetical protein